MLHKIQLFAKEELTVRREILSINVFLEAKKRFDARRDY